MKGITRSALTATLLSTSSLAFASSCPDILQGKQRLLNSTEEIDQNHEPKTMNQKPKTSTIYFRPDKQL